MEDRNRQKNKNKRKIACRRIDTRRTSKRQSRLGSFVIMAAVVFLCVVSAKVVINQKHKSEELAATETKLEQKIDASNKEKEELVALEQYMKTNKYIEDVAKNKLGLVYPDEIVIKPVQ